MASLKRNSKVKDLVLNKPRTGGQLGFSMQDKGRPLPKFGEWDVNNPASAEGFTVIFSKARDEKRTNGNSKGLTPKKNKQNDHYEGPSKCRKWFCCG